MEFGLKGTKANHDYSLLTSSCDPPRMPALTGKMEGFSVFGLEEKMNILKNSPANLNIIIHLGRNKNQGYPFIKCIHIFFFLAFIGVKQLYL